MNSDFSGVKSFLEKHTKPDDCLLIAVSGGADSIGLLALLSDEIGNPAERLVVGHVNHHIRRDSAEDLDVINKVAAPRGIRVICSDVDAPAHAKSKRLSLEVAARELRYAALEDMACENSCRWILTGHTMDDSAETVLMRMRSGAPWYEWSGIPAVRSDILRPLLTVQREDLRAWVTAKRLPFHEDETNSELRFQRNRLRFKLRNCPEFWNRHQIHHFAASGEALEEALTAWRKMVYVLPVAIQKNLNEGTVGLAIDEIFRYFNNLTFLPVEVLWGWLNGQQDARLPSKLRRKISSFLSGKTPEAALLLPDGITLLRRGRQAWLVRNLARPIQMKVSMGTNRLPQYGGQLVINGERTDGAVPIRKDLLNHVLTLRTWHAGDHIKIARRPRKKISDLLAEMKLNPAQRARLLVLTDEQGPLMILGGAMDERALPDGTQGEVIWISWCEDESIGAGHVI